MMLDPHHESDAGPENAGRAAASVRAVAAAVAPVRRAPRFDAPLDTEALFGERVEVLDEAAEGWTRVRLCLDGYEGYMPSEALTAPGRMPTHRVTALASFVFPAPDLKRPPLDRLGFGARVAVLAEAHGYARIENGFVWARHLSPVEAHAADFVAVAERFLGVPYLWGGRSSLGLDCSGLVQLALGAAGIPAPRDSGPQEIELGRDVNWETQGLRRGDLVFWPGHVGIMRDDVELLHANAHHMAVAAEPFAAARARIAAGGCDVRRVKRLGSRAA
jgi:hypothetical protein